MQQYQEIQEQKFLEVRRSECGGLGLFALKDIPQGTFLLEYTGQLVPLDQTNAKSGKYLFKINSKWAVDGKRRDNLGRYINHFCQPNCEVQISRRQVFIYALRDISKGEELGYNYGDDYFLTDIKPHGCKCPFCRLKNIIHSQIF